MAFADLAWEAQLHREVYIAILNGALKAPGSKKRFAERVGITPQYLSYLLDPYNHRTPSPEVAEKIASSLPIPAEQRQDLLKHLLLANERRLQTQEAIQSELPERPVKDFLQELGKRHHAASFASDPQLAKVQYRVVREAGQSLLQQLNPETHPLAFVEACFLVHDAQCVLNRPDEALYHAKLARLVMDSLDPIDYRQEKKRFDHHQINAIRAEAVAYHNLQLYHMAYDLCLQAEATEAMTYQSELWKPHLYRDKINALKDKPRFAISEAEGLADQVKAICEQRANDFDPLMVLLINRSLGQAYLQYGNYKKADRVLRAQVEGIDEVPHVGPLHRALLLRTYAKLRWEEGDRYEWEYFIKRALNVALEGGLNHQANQIQKEYGSHTEDILEKMKFREEQPDPSDLESLKVHLR